MDMNEYVGGFGEFETLWTHYTFFQINETEKLWYDSFSFMYVVSLVFLGQTSFYSIGGCILSGIF